MTSRSAARVLVDASNLRSGGGVQVAASFLDQLAVLRDDADAVRRWPFLDTLDVEASLTVHANLSRGTAARLGLRTVERHWRAASTWRPPTERYDATFVVFGPEYGPPRAPVRILGCADGLSVLDGPGWVPRSPLLRARRLVKRRLWERQLQGVDVVVETASLADAVVALGAHRARVHVVPNGYHQVFDHPDRWRPVPLPPAREGVARLLYVARGYPHKNHALLAGVHLDLRLRHGIESEVVVTLTEEELAAQGAALRACAVNVGPVPIAAVPPLYAECDVAVFPSLVEAFSATPLEALRMGTPLVASDRGFVRDLCGDAAAYADPRDAVAFAGAIARVLRDPAERDRLVEAGDKRVTALPTAQDRAADYLELVSRALARGPA